MAGDSTIIHQFQVLQEFIMLRSDFVPVVGDKAEIRQKYEVSYGGTPSEAGSVTFHFVRVLEGCMMAPHNPLVPNAYAIYFGCGMHLLHLTPCMGPHNFGAAMYNWLHYEEVMEAVIKQYRVRNKQLKLLFMTNHHIDVSKYFGAWSAAVEGYSREDEHYMNMCKKKLNDSLLPQDAEGANLGHICLETLFTDVGVRGLNQRALPLMQGLGVDMVPGHTLTEGESWATSVGDGRHYPLLVPVELEWFLVTLEMSRI
ncbi:unnamed protein product [Discosporangium mesarthrocarpum]